MNQEQPSPREVTIRATIETARRNLPTGYNEDDEGSDALFWEIGQTMYTEEIESWADLRIPAGYELADDEQREEYQAYLDSKRKP